MSNNELVLAKKAIGSVSSGKQVNEDSWMTMWCNTNWGDLLQPAPLSIALLGSILIIASSTDDFSLLTERDPNDKSPPIVWKYATYPDSFKTCLMQMVGNGYDAFEAAHKNMTRIQNASSQMPDEIKLAVQTVIKASPQEVGAYLGGQINGVLQLANICMTAAKDCESGFERLAGLAQEMVLACTHKVGTDQQKMDANRVHLEVLKIQKDQEALTLKQAEESHKMMKDSFMRAENDFHDSVKNVPTGWDLVGMQAVESLTSLAVSAGNAAIASATMRSTALTAGLGALKNSSVGNSQVQAGAPVQAPAPPPNSAPNGVATQGNAAALTDPGLMQARSALDMANNIRLLVNGGPEGKPDWNKIRGKDGSQSGGQYVKAQLETLKTRLDTTGTKPVSVQLEVFVAQAIDIITSIVKTGTSAGASDDVFDNRKPQIDKLISDLQQLVTSTNILLQQTGTPAVGPATPPPAASTSSSATKLAVENSKFQVDQTRANLDSSRQAFDKASARLAEGQKAIGKTIADMTNLSLSNATLEKMLPVLKQAVGAFTILRAQFSQLLQFFQSVASLLTDVMGPSVQRWAGALTDTQKLGGVTVSAFTRQLIYTQMMVPLKVSMLAEKISGTYLQVSDNYILPAQRSVHKMLQFAKDDSPAAKAELESNLRAAQAKLQHDSNAASEHISELVGNEQKKFSSAITARIETIEAAVKPAIPAITQGVPENIKQVTEAHIQDFADAQTAQMENNTMYDEDNMM